MAFEGEIPQATLGGGAGKGGARPREVRHDPPMVRGEALQLGVVEPA
jgi:hypothetical protein